ncbi:MAG: 2Fe-2S iron-sulfur cluster-binding protein [Acidimicrobiia bacterium]|nr:MAG: 2Fe-2S iron-sulfur cluster-binding protein [Acidimicrobiia bacterium]
MIEPKVTLVTTLVEITVDGETVSVPEGSTVLEACASVDIDIPTLCYLETLAPFNSCRVCVVEVEGSRTLVPACSREITPDMTILTESGRVQSARKTVYELLASTVDMTLVEDETREHMERYGVDPGRWGSWARPRRDVKIEDDLYIRDYDKCIMCYRCVAACGPDAQNTFAIDVAGRGLAATISTEFDITLPESACVYCGNCVGVCPTGALMFTSEYTMRKAGTWDEPGQSVTTTVCSFCGVGCNLELHVQDNRIVKVTSPLDHEVTSGHLCIKGRFGYAYVQPEFEA